ncbi:hypothetical protein CASFOL_029367 [Castilleja foliolosa]|uniref:Uncharacterized protein n=1 Tax=Castilleja foliolosa TaxID=1961234 RepID=A0ABD3CAC4_9LAMI
MAKMFSCLVFILVILTTHVFDTQGRNAKHKNNIPMSPNELGQHRVRLDEAYPSAFRPTSPGHSPGTGHSLRGQRVKLEDEVGSITAFRPTTPGSSPGIGHSKHD